jgi:hypothetical protein
VRVRRYMCKDCRHTFLADAPFYDGCLYGKPVVDLCLYLAASTPFNRVESILKIFGLIGILIRTTLYYPGIGL